MNLMGINHCLILHSTEKVKVHVLTRRLDYKVNIVLTSFSLQDWYEVGYLEN